MNRKSMFKKTQIKWEVVITVIISIASVFISWQAYKISELQTEIAKSSSLPNISIKEMEILDEETGKPIDTVIQISNLEGRLNNYSSQIVTFLQCLYSDEDNNFYQADIPVESYYILGDKSGTNIGIIENKGTASNYSKIELLRQDIKIYNEGDEYLSAILKSYLKISYVNLLGEVETIYYQTDIFETNLIDKTEGEQVFKFYEEMKNQDLGVNPNRSERITVDSLIDKIRNGSEIEIEVQEVEKENSGLMTEIVGALIGFIGTLCGTFFAYRLGMKQQNDNDKKNEAHAASILYYDLKSIEDYLKCERSSVNLRYSADWQSIAANCPFLSHQQVSYIYKLYDKTYNYNFFYRRKEKSRQSFSKEDIPQYEELKRMMFDTSEAYINEKKYTLEYEELLKELEKYVLKH